MTEHSAVPNLSLDVPHYACVGASARELYRRLIKAMAGSGDPRVVIHTVNGAAYLQVLDNTTKRPVPMLMPDGTVQDDPPPINDTYICPGPLCPQ